MKPEDIDPEEAQRIVANLAKHLHPNGQGAILNNNEVNRTLAAAKPKGDWPMMLGARLGPYTIWPGRWESDGRYPGGSGAWNPDWPGWDIGRGLGGGKVEHSQVTNEEMDAFLVKALKHRGVDITNLQRRILECDRVASGLRGVCTDPATIPKNEDGSWCGSCVQNDETLEWNATLETIPKNANEE